VPRPRAADDFTAIRARMEELRPVRRPRAADDLETIRGRMEELRRERAQVSAEKREPRPESAATQKRGFPPAIRRASQR
jgi:hypothetical protein